MTTRKTSTKRQRPKTCKQLTQLVSAYFDGSLSPRLRRSFQAHLRVCPDCVNFLRTYRKTVEITRRIEGSAIPSKVRSSLLAFLRQHAQQTRPQM